MSRLLQTTDLVELELIESLLRLSGCIKIEFIPGSENNLEKKKFKWKLIELNEKKLEL